MTLLYDIAMWMMGGVMRLAALFNRKAALWVGGRRGIFRRMEQAISADDRVVWVHCASLGEFEQGRPVIEAIKARDPECKVLLTFFSPSGYEIRKNYEGADYIFYLPADTPRNARRFMRAAHPEVAIFVKYEFWLNYLKQLRASRCRTFIVSAIFRRDSVFFKWYGAMFRRALGTFERLFVQNEESRGLLAELGVENVTVAGDTRFDRVAAIAAAARRIEVIEKFADGSPVFVAGSTWPPDEELIARAVADFPDIKFVVAPHEMDQARIDRFVASSARPAVRYTLCDGTADPAAQVMVLDTIGILSSAYRYADYAYIGGGFGVGIHNTLEAATFGLPIAFGPNFAKFQEAKDMIELGTARSVADYTQLAEWFSALVADRALYASVREVQRAYIARNVGATDKIIEAIYPPR